jgi:hypothetical protein
MNSHKYGISIVRIYNGLTLAPSFIIDNQRSIIKQLNNIKTDPNLFARQIMKEDDLESLPLIEINETCESIKDKNLTSLGKIICTYNAIPRNTEHKFSTLLLFLTIWSILGAIGLMFWLAEKGKRERIDTQCYYYIKNGVPSLITIHGEEYPINSDGSLSYEDKLFMNPYHRELLAGMTDNDCIKINTVKDN